MHNDIANYMDRNKAVLLVLLHLSATFDMIHHDCLINTLHTSFGLYGIALDWFKSYIQGRLKCVSISGTSSSSINTKLAVLQGFVLGLVLFLLYTKPLQHNIE